MVTILVIADAAFVPNPVTLGQATKLSVSVIEVVQNPYTRVVTAGTNTCGTA